MTTLVQHPCTHFLLSDTVRLRYFYALHIRTPKPSLTATKMNLAWFVQVGLQFPAMLIYFRIHKHPDEWLCVGSCGTERLCIH